MHLLINANASAIISPTTTGVIWDSSNWLAMLNIKSKMQNIVSFDLKPVLLVWFHISITVFI